ncbi:uncharacterized protein LOC114169447 [Vigna unguiculata]|uniref:uncharacterized protein LOC114169447 n=1 Tax=Vigna unguiculata TaxID=3917 RepID=UPI001016B0CF|nr:uncharacterized protein LOC114169447 [Vigna unguiculata]
MDSSEGSEYSEQGPQTLDRGLSDDEWVSKELGSDIGEVEEDEGTYFSEKGDFVEAIRSYALENGRSLKIVKNDRRRVRVKCLGGKGKCPWLAYCGYMQAVKSWQLRKIVDTHTCSREFNLRLINAKWERAIATESVEGSFKDQYKRLYDYAHELLKTNPGSTVKLKVKENEGEPIFERFYTCFKILPIAYVVVEVENKDSWTWFLDLLIEDLGGKQLCGGCTFISDQQKGLLPTIQDLLPGVDQRFCVRHLYANFRKRFPGKNLKRLMWSAASTTHPEAWEQEMRNTKEINVEAFKYLIAIPPRYWSRSRFTHTAQSDTIVNNMSEAFNSVLVTTRTKPIIKMLEEIRIYLMNRWAANRESWSADKIFEVRHVSQIGDKFVVNIDEASCTCRKWSISGIPCCHALSAMKFLGINGEDFISTWFRKNTYEETYSSIIFPINGQNVWDITPYPDLLPPEKRIMLGRPKKKRRLQDWELRKDETQMTNAGLRKRCGFCKQLDHNKNKCSQYKAHLKTTSEASNQPNPPTAVPSTQSSEQQNPTPVPSAQSSQQQNPPLVPSAQSSQQQNPP